MPRSYSRYLKYIGVLHWTTVAAGPKQLILIPCKSASLPSCMRSKRRGMLFTLYRDVSSLRRDKRESRIHGIHHHH